MKKDNEAYEYVSYKTTEILEKNQTEILEIESSVSQVKTSVEHLINSLDQVDEYQDLKTRLMNYYIQTVIKKKKNERMTEHLSSM
jgi:hypothetical protein